MRKVPEPTIPAGGIRIAVLGEAKTRKAPAYQKRAKNKKLRIAVGFEEARDSIASAQKAKGVVIKSPRKKKKPIEAAAQEASAAFLARMAQAGFEPAVGESSSVVERSHRPKAVKPRVDVSKTIVPFEKPDPETQVLEKLGIDDIDATLADHFASRGITTNPWDGAVLPQPKTTAELAWEGTSPKSGPV
jgi:hypothetical protein